MTDNKKASGSPHTWSPDTGMYGGRSRRGKDEFTERDPVADAFAGGFKDAHAAIDPTPETAEENMEALTWRDVPETDAVAEDDSPVDPVSPPTDAINGTDLLNGAGAVEFKDHEKDR